MGSRSPIPYPSNYATKYSSDYDLIMEVKRHAIAGTEEEDPQAHLMFFGTLCGTSKTKDVCRELVLLSIFRFSLKDDAETCFN